MISTELDVLQGLDFEYQAPCDVRGCEGDALTTTKYLVHEECQAHTHWYALCFEHTDKSLQGKTVCKRCQHSLAVRSVVYL